MVGITAAVWLRLYYERIGEIRARGIRSQDLTTSRQAAELLKNVNAAENFRNLFEVPVLFYALCVLIFVTSSVTPLLLGGAWAFVALCTLHSLIHCTYNRVIHRFIVYVLSTLILFTMWGVLGVKLL
jgi:hypothetical protein